MISTAARKQDDEFVSPVAGNRAVGAPVRARSVRGLPRKRIARLVAVLAVDLLEVVEIEKEDRERAVALPSLLDG